MIEEKYMKEALKEAKKAYDKDEIPVGAVIVKEGKIIARGHNIKETKQNALKHAEIIAIEKASRKLNNWRLEGCEIYVTLEPCPMCAGAILNSRIQKLIIGATDSASGACGTVLNLFEYPFNHSVEIQRDIKKEECEVILKKFFRELRERKKQDKIK